jgi:hypothetical protein
MLTYNTIFFSKLPLLHLARSEGLEPPTIGSEVRSSIQLGYERISIEWGERGDLNPRPLEPQSRALTSLSYAHHIYFKMARLEGIEPPTYGLEVRCSILLSHRREILHWSGKRVSNPRQLAWKASALPTELFPQSRGERI